MTGSSHRPPWNAPGGRPTVPDELPEAAEPDDLFAALQPDDPEGETPCDSADPVTPLRATGIEAGVALGRPLTLSLALRPYQEEAISAWTRHAGRGLVVLPTGAGKTVVALAMLARLAVRTLVVAPTIDLLGQWRTSISTHLGITLDDVGIIGGGKRTLRDITVITYDSAAMPHRRLDGFGLLIVDEAHHLPARAYRAIAAKVNAPFRLGLSATLERSDHGHLDLAHLIGPVVYERTPADLARDQFIANYREKRVFVDLSHDEQARYAHLMAEFSWYIASQRGSLGPPQTFFTQLIRRSAHDPAARSALRAHHQARMIALNAEAKIGKILELLERHRDDKVIVFSEYNAMVDLVSERLLLPAITYRTALPERRRTLDRFRSGEYSKLVTGRVLNEGVDVPDANVAIIVSGSSGTREYIQRLGRVLRPKAADAWMYELITRRTSEGRSSRKRRPAEPIDPDRARTRRESAA